MKKIRFLFAGNFEIQNKPYAFEKGDIVDVSDTDADVLVAGLCAELVDDKPVEKAKKAKKEAETWQDEH